MPPRFPTVFVMPALLLLSLAAFSTPANAKVDASTIRINGVVVVPGDDYRITVNSFMAAGGDNFSELLNGTNPLGGAIDVDALVEYLGDNTPQAPGPQNRITRLN